MEVDEGSRKREWRRERKGEMWGKGEVRRGTGRRRKRSKRNEIKRRGIREERERKDK